MKREITKQEAILRMRSIPDRPDFKDRLYEFAQKLCDDEIKRIESECIILGPDGKAWTGDKDEKWFDECKEDVMKGILERATGEDTGDTGEDTGYSLICWPESQSLMEEEGFEEHSSLADCEKFGSMAFFVENAWLNE